jgi:hypothetical protein
LAYFRATPDAKNCDLIQVQHTHGFSGPKKDEPSLKVLPPEDTNGPPCVIVLDDTGNRFRRTPSQWPAAVSQNNPDSKTVVVHKLHRPLPENTATRQANKTRSSDVDKGPSLWDTVSQYYGDRRLTIISIDDLRDKDAPINRGLSWELTALDVVWHLLNVEAFAPLRDCAHLIVRLGLDGAIYWHCSAGDKPQYRAWLFYDPAGIEGTGESACEGQMVGYGSAFTAALVKQLAAAGGDDCLAPATDATGIVTLSPYIEAGIKSGLIASHRLLRLGFGKRGVEEPKYPAGELFEPEDKSDPFFACQPIPIIPHAAVPDRGYWRLLDSIFSGKTALLHRAVALTATGGEAVEPQDNQAAELLKQVPKAVFAKDLRTWDRREIENYRALYTLMLDYISQPTAPRPLSVAVFGPPGAGKSFGVKMVAKALGELGRPRPIAPITFNLSQYQTPDQLADAFHLVRDLVLKGKIPLVFFDEFDASLGTRLGWLRYFLGPMQDAEFLDRGTPHPIGQSIFVFAGGTCSTYAEFAAPFLNETDDEEKLKDFTSAKGPDFLSRLRGTLDVPSLDLNVPFDPFGPVEAFPCEAAILLRRAGILAFQLGQKAPDLQDSTKKLRVSPTVLRALLHLPQFEHGNRSFEALLDMSHLPHATRFTPALLPSAAQAGLHANAQHLSQLLATDYPYPPEDREAIAKTIHKEYVKQRLTEPNHNPADPSLKDWSHLSPDLKESNREQADHIAVKLRAAGLWFRKTVPGASAVADPRKSLDKMVERLARAEHARWVAEKRSQGWIPARDTSRESRNNELLLHNCLFKWKKLTDDLKDLDRDTVRHIPDVLASAGYEVFRP